MEALKKGYHRSTCLVAYSDDFNSLEKTMIEMEQSDKLNKSNKPKSN